MGYRLAPELQVSRQHSHLFPSRLRPKRLLPLLLLQRMSSYRTADAAGLAGLLAFLCLGLMWAADAAFRTKR